MPTQTHQNNYSLLITVKKAALSFSPTRLTKLKQAWLCVRSVVDYSLAKPFTFSAKEKDSETGLNYFGSRYYNSDLSIWLSVDPMASKYPSFSPYTYCANNPIKLVDPNGEEIYVGDDYYYRDGKLYTKNDGKVYNPIKGSFEEKALNSLNTLKRTKQGSELMSPFEGSTNHDVNILDANVNNGKSRVDNETLNSETGAFQSATIYWNSEGTTLSTTDGFKRNSTADLGHEFSHTFDMVNKATTSRNFDYTPEGEWRAVYRENMIRVELNLPYRRGYQLNLKMSNGKTRAYLSKMLINETTPFLPPGF